jgi:transposase
LDVSLATTAICAVDENGAIIKEGVAASDPDEIADWLEQLGVAFERVGLETGSTATWLYSELRDRGLPAVCIDPRRLRAVTKTMPIKNDRNDARAIAHCTPLEIAAFSFRTTILRRPSRRPRRQERA